MKAQLLIVETNGAAFRTKLYGASYREAVSQQALTRRHIALTFLQIDTVYMFTHRVNIQTLPINSSRIRNEWLEIACAPKVEKL
jgi:hypothetical protein